MRWVCVLILGSGFSVKGWSCRMTHCHCEPLWESFIQQLSSSAETFTERPLLLTDSRQLIILTSWNLSMMWLGWGFQQWDLWGILQTLLNVPWLSWENLDWQRRNSHSELNGTMDWMDLTQLIHGPTRITNSTSTQIDLVFSNRPERIEIIQYANRIVWSQSDFSGKETE